MQSCNSFLFALAALVGFSFGVGIVLPYLFSFPFFQTFDLLAFFPFLTEQTLSLLPVHYIPCRLASPLLPFG